MPAIKVSAIGTQFVKVGDRVEVCPERPGLPRRPGVVRKYDRMSGNYFVEFSDGSDESLWCDQGEVFNAKTGRNCAGGY